MTTDIEKLAAGQEAILRYFAVCEKEARTVGAEPSQYRLILCVAALGSANITQLAESLSLRHHSVGELVGRSMKAGLVSREGLAEDKRVRVIRLTEVAKVKLSTLHLSLQMEVGMMKRLGAALKGIAEDKAC